MSDSKQPFTDYATKKDAPFEMSRYVVPGVCILVMIVLGLCLWQQAQQHDRDMDALQTRLNEANAALAATQGAAQTNDAGLQQQIAGLQADVADLEKEKDQTVQSAKGLEDEMKSDLESKDVTISKLQGKLTVNILDRILFDSGEADLKPDGQAVMLKIAAFLAQHPELKIHVIGHTDNVPIRGNARSRFPTNWELSTARALAAVRFLTERAGVDPRRVGAVGYGEYRPVADNSTAEGRARNRRIAITILPDELAGADIAPAAPAGVSPGGSTNSPDAGTSPAAAPEETNPVAR
jgi:chemotaxis protein MotB